MAYQNDKQRYNLENLIPEMVSLSKAPSYADLTKATMEKHAPRESAGVKTWLIPDEAQRQAAIDYEIYKIMIAESRINYLSVDGGGTLYAVQNPALMVYMQIRGLPVTRKKPKYIGAYSDYDRNRRKAEKPESWDNISPDAPLNSTKQLGW